MVDSGLYLFISSNASTRLIPQTTVSDFTMQLVRSLELMRAEDGVSRSTMPIQMEYHQLNCHLGNLTAGQQT